MKITCVTTLTLLLPSMSKSLASATHQAQPHVKLRFFHHKGSRACRSLAISLQTAPHNRFHSTHNAISISCFSDLTVCQLSFCSASLVSTFCTHAQNLVLIVRPSCSWSHPCLKTCCSWQTNVYHHPRDLTSSKGEVSNDNVVCVCACRGSLYIRRQRVP
jgi:hypothetical protein